MNPEEIRHLITNSSEPLLFRNIVQWNISNWNLSNWKEHLANIEMNFRTGLFQMTSEPQWERATSIETLKFEQFLQEFEQTNKWFYFDYKYLNSNLLSVNGLTKDMCWNSLGFPEIKPEDGTIWIGSKGAHTPCHKDTYGFNLIHQIYGRKLWILFPPEENLKPTRVPYEESSIYSQLNFFSPLPQDFQGINNCRIVTLEPGDVLYLPHHWWHYVENLETAISINVWIPSPNDDNERLKEALTQLFVKQICNLSDEETNKYMLNPNMVEILNDECSKTFGVFNECKNIYQRSLQSTSKKIKLEEQPKPKELKFTVNDVLEKYKSILKIPELSYAEFLDFLKKQNERFGQDLKEGIESKRNIQSAQVELLKALTDSDVINLITDKLIKR